MRLYGLALAALASSIASSAMAAASADVAIVMTNGTASTTAGTDTTYTLTASNYGPDNASTAVVTYVLPPALTFVSSIPGAGWSCSTPAIGMTGTISCTNLSLASGSTESLTITARLSATASGTLSSTATISATEPDPNPASNSATDSDTIIPAAPAPATIPTLTEWAMILFATLLAGGAALTLHRRRQTA